MDIILTRENMDRSTYHKREWHIFLSIGTSLLNSQYVSIAINSKIALDLAPYSYSTIQLLKTN